MGHWSRREVLGAMVAGGACALAPPLLESRPISGVWLRGVLLVDGSLAPPRYTDVLVMGDRISDIGPAPEAATRGARVIDGAGRVLAPGFIDMHAHGDPLTDSYAPHVAMGVTTVLLGQDGGSPSLPDAERTAGSLAAWMAAMESQAEP